MASEELRTLEYGADIRENKQNFRTPVTGKITKNYIAAVLLVDLDLKFWG